MKSEIRKAQSGLWATRLEVLYKEKFKEVLPATIMEELKFRPDIVKIEEPIAGKYLLYAPKQQQVCIWWCFAARVIQNKNSSEFHSPQKRKHGRIQ